MPVKRTKSPAVKKDVKKEVNINKSVNNIVTAMNKKLGEGAVSLGFPKNEDGSIKTIKRISTGSFIMDLKLGGGLPLGRFVEISGGFSSTKTTQTMHIVKSAQKEGLICAVIDVEASIDENYAEAIGVNVDSLIYNNPDSMEEGLQLILDLQKTGEVHLAVLDSLAAMSPNKEQEVLMDETMRMGIPQQMFGEFCRKYTANNNRLVREGKEPFTVICINQLREKIGAYGDAEYTPGGRAKGFTAGIDMRLRRGDWITEGTGENKEIVGQVVKFKIDKNKTFKRMQTGEFDFYFAENNANIPIFHNDVIKEIILAGVEYDVIERGGSWFTFRDLKVQGVNALTEALRNNADIVEEIKIEVIEAFNRRVL